MRKRATPSWAHLDRTEFARASAAQRTPVVARWLDDGPLDPFDVNLVRTVRERDLANARALFGPFVTMTGLFVALLAVSLAIGALVAILVAPVGIALGLAGGWIELRRVMCVSRQLARLEARI